MQQITLGKKDIFSELPAFVMGIVNVTPDSFYEESRGGVDLALQMIEQGADIIDIGGESTRPGFKEISDDEQIARIIPIITEIRKKSRVPISVDTRSAVVFQKAVEAGADIMNDVSALEDEKSVKIVAETGSSVILMHGFNQDENHTPNSRIPAQVLKFLKQRTKYAIKNGIQKEKIIWDPGIGFGKTMEENVILIKNTDNLSKTEFPVLMALSRKRVISYMTECSEKDRLTGTLSANMFAVLKGARILRVHDVKETVNMLKVMKNLV